MKDSRQLRKEVLSARNRLSPKEIESMSSTIRNTMLSLEEVQKSSNIFIYVNFRSEVETARIIADLLVQGKQISVPLTRVKERRLDIITITDPEKELTPGYCGIPEPKEELVATQVIDPQVLDLIILPGSVFDMRCGRFGYGGGYYDRLLSSIPQAGRIALAFELQIVERIPLQKHDEILDLIVTEERVIRGGIRAT